MYRTLQPEKIVATLDKLQARITQRFPNGGLCRVCEELRGVARKSHERAEKIAAPAYGLRTATAVMIAAGLVMLSYVAHLLVSTKKINEDLFSTIQAVDATFNIVILTGASIFFLVSLEERMKRRRALRALNELRTFVHVIDMHQLTKDPIMIEGLRTADSPTRDMTPFELTRYLNYCSEMLSLTDKLAALYAQSTSDAVVIDAVSDFSTVTANMSAKIWQKITLVQTLTREAEAKHLMPLPPFTQ
jgi:hypothetical protein